MPLRMGPPGERLLRAAWVPRRAALSVSPDERAEYERIMPTGWTDTLPEARCQKRGCGVLGWWVPQRPPSHIRRGPSEGDGRDERWRWMWFYPAWHMTPGSDNVWRPTKAGKELERRADGTGPNWTWRRPQTPDGPYEIMPVQADRCMLPTRVRCPRCAEVNVVRPPWASEPGYADPPWYTQLYNG